MANMTFKQIITVLGLFLFITVLFLAPKANAQQETFWYAIALAVLMVIFWLFEVVSIYVTALFPFVLGIPLGLLDASDLTSCYGHKYIYLFMGGFILSLALEKWEAHKQIAEAIIRFVGTSKARILLGFLFSTGLLSMWISNTASALMMLPMALGILANIKHENKSKFSTFLLLSVAYGASIGGMATLVGSPPNILMAGLLEDRFGIIVNFIDWMKVGLPLSLILLTIVFIFFYLLLGKERKEKLYEAHSEKIKWTKNQVHVVFLFSVIILLWSFRSPLIALTGIIYTDEGVAVLGAISLFFLPGSKKGQKLLTWKDTQNLPWGILILFGGGMALAKMLEINGVIEKLTLVFSNYANAPLVVLLSVLVVIAIFGTEIMSNMALVSVFVPLVADFSLNTDYSIIQLCMPITLASSCAFMLPVGTPPNAIVFSSGQLKINQMAKTGFVLNLIGVIIVVLFSVFFI